MATTSGKGKAYVANASVPTGASVSPKGSAHVAKGMNHVKRVSGGNMPSSVSGVSLGTTHGNHNVAHPVNGK